MLCKNALTETEVEATSTRIKEMYLCLDECKKCFEKMFATICKTSQIYEKVFYKTFEHEYEWAKLTWKIPREHF